jgi:transcriptional regulator with XRE-family HTH domain
VAPRALADPLRTACRDSGFTLNTLARETGLPLETLKKIFAGRRMPLTTTALRVAAALGVDVEDLFGGAACR